MVLREPVYHEQAIRIKYYRGIVSIAKYLVPQVHNTTLGWEKFFFYIIIIIAKTFNVHKVTQKYESEARLVSRQMKFS